MSLLPESSLVSDIIPSPNNGERADNRQPDMIVLHYTGMESEDEALARLCSAQSEVSSHYFVFADGRVVQSVAEERRAWHAGESFWNGETDINSCAIGIEIANPGHDHGYPNFPSRQIAAVTALCRGIVVRRDIPPSRVLAHSDVAPARKRDPGEKFPWEFLFRSGVGHWVAPAPYLPGPTLMQGDSGAVIGELKTALSSYGYRVSEGNDFDETTRDAVTAFQRHFRPSRVDGTADSSTLKTLRALLDARARVPGETAQA